jgi:hypothetical protein
MLPNPRKTTSVRQLGQIDIEDLRQAVIAIPEHVWEAGDGIAYHFKEGQAVEVSNMAVHGVENAGKSDRIHLIFEYYDVDQPDSDWINS